LSPRKSITTSHAAVACDVCGRTLLRGEHADSFIAGGSRRMVCELCEPRAANEGWIREGDDALTVRRDASGGGRSLLARLRARRDDAAPDAPETAVAARGRRAQRLERQREPDEQLTHAASEGDPPQQAEAAGRFADAEASSKPAERHGAARERRRVHAVPTNADLKMERALDVFNASAHPRRVAGVARSLGTPAITVLLSETEGAIVSIVVAWELCWYRYEVDLADEAAGVRVIAQGAELSELAAQERRPNATADERGLLGLAA